MASRVQLIRQFSICPECENRVEILNHDFESSMKLHKQLHKPLDIVSKDVDLTQEKVDDTSSFNKKYFKQDVEISKDVHFFQLQAQRQKPGKTDAQVSCSSDKIQSKYNYDENRKDLAKPVFTSFVDAIFHTLPNGLKAHRGFISEQGCNVVLCEPCKTIIQPIFNIKEHLQTKLHEDNIIQVIKSLMPSELQDQMDFVSFYDSNLSCNLCGCKIDLCSNNLHKTVIDICTHNVSKCHLCEKSNKSNSSKLDKPLAILKNLALIDPIVNENQKLIEYRMNPYYKCKVCDTAITYSENEKELLINFKSHMNSPNHGKAIHVQKKVMIEEFDTSSYVQPHENVSTNSINTNLEQPFSYARGSFPMFKEIQLVPVPGVEHTNPPITQMNLSSPREENVKVVDILDQVHLYSTHIQINRKFFSREKGLVICNLCKCTIPSSNNIDGMIKNMTTHLGGTMHIKMQTVNEGSSTAAHNRIKSVPMLQCTSLHNAQIDTSSTSRDATTIIDNVDRTPIHGKKLNSLKGNIMSHVTGKKHSNKAVKELDGKLNKPSSSGNELHYTSRNVSEITKLDHFNAVYSELLKTNQRIKFNVKYLEVKEYGCVCNLCNHTPIVFKHASDIEQNIMSHICGKEHEENEAKIDDKLMKPAVQGRLLFNIREKMSQIDKLEENITSHITEKKRNKKRKKKLGYVSNTLVLEDKTSTNKKWSKTSRDETTIIDDVDCLYKELLETNAVIKLNAEHLEREGEFYICKLCNWTPISGKKTNSLKGNIMSHVTGKKHSNKAVKELDGKLNKPSLPRNELHSSSRNVLQITKLDYFNAVYSELLKTNRRIKLNVTYLEVKEDGCVCNLCNHTPIVFKHASDIEQNIMSHICGKKHEENEAKIDDKLKKPVKGRLLSNIREKMSQIDKVEENITSHITEKKPNKKRKKKLGCVNVSNTLVLEQITSTNKKWSKSTEVDLVNALYEQLLETNSLIKSNFEYIKREGNFFNCELCNQASIYGNVNSVKLLESNIMNHITLRNHNRKLKLQFNGILDKVPCRPLLPKILILDLSILYEDLLEANALIKRNESYFEREGNLLTCKLCDQILTGKNRKSLRKKIIGHIKGDGHSKKASKETAHKKVAEKPCGNLINKQIIWLGEEKRHKSHIRGKKHTEGVAKRNYIPYEEGLSNADTKIYRKLLVKESGGVYYTVPPNLTEGRIYKLPIVYMKNVEFIIVRPGYLFCKLCKFSIKRFCLKEHLDYFHCGQGVSYSVLYSDIVKIFRQSKVPTDITSEKSQE